jgi:hypothetical protein
MDDWLEAAYEDRYISDFNEDELEWDEFIEIKDIVGEEDEFSWDDEP